VIRPAEARDAEAVAAIWNPVIRDSAITFNAIEKDPDDLVRLFIEKRTLGHAFLVAEEAGALLGFASYGQFRAGVGYARSFEHTIILAPGARGRGLGRALIGAIEDHARAAGGHGLIAGVSGENEAGIAFHKAMGFAEVARVPEVGWKFERWMDLVLLQKFL
jgi:L-amino acid N-acyltransferase YncA